MEIIGKQFGDLFIVELDVNSDKKQYIAKCSCGKTISVKKKEVNNGNKKSCGCRKYIGQEAATKASKERSNILRHSRMIGRRFGIITVTGIHGNKNINGINRFFYNTKCDCGWEGVKRSDALSSAKSCGCLVAQKNIERALPNAMAAKNNYYNKTKQSAIKRELGFDLTLEEVIEISSKDCAYCGCPPENTEYLKKTGVSQFLRNGIDRVNNNIGYIKENCVPCCFICNRAKSDLLIEDWNNYLNRLTKFHIIKENDGNNSSTPTT